MKRPALMALSLVLVACGSPASETGAEPVVFTAADEACVEFYRAVQESALEETVYMRELANRISELGHAEAAAILSALADQWEVGVWEAGQDEVWQSALWAQAGELLGAAGAVRCADLSEWWGIDGYEGEPDSEEMLDRQASIWSGIDLDDYYLLVARRGDGEDLTQAHVRVQSGEIVAIAEVDSGPFALDDLPHTVDEAYAMLLDGSADNASYDLVWSAPRVMRMTDGSAVILIVDTKQYPEPIEELDQPEGKALSG